MSAPGQGGDAAQQGQNGQQGGEGQGEAQQQQAQPDFGAMMQQLQEISGGQEQLRDHLLSEPWQQQQQTEEPAPSVDLRQLDELGLATGDDTVDQQTAQNLAQIFEQIADQKAEQKTAAIAQQFEEFKQERDFERLANEFPELQDQETANTTHQAAHTIAQSIGMPEAATKAEFIRLVHVGIGAYSTAQQEGVGTPEPAHLEGGGGAIPGGPQVDTRIDEIMNSGGKKGSGVLPF